MFTEIDRDYHEGDWPQSRETIVLRIDGVLADKVRRYYKRSGLVLLTQFGQKGATGWSWGSWMTIDGVEVCRHDEGEPRATVFSEGALDSTGKFTRQMTGSTRMVRHLIEIEQVTA